MEKTWWKEAVGYQIYVRSFYDSNGDGIGDLNGIIEKIEYLKYLGVDLIYLNPVNKSPNDDNGYDVSDFYDIMDEFGSLITFKELLETLHSNGMKLIMDLVINHSSDEHPYFQSALKDRNSKYRDYYIFKDSKDVPNNWLSFFGGSAWEYTKETDSWYLHIFSKKQPDFNFKNKELRDEIKSIIRFWKDLGVDGFRFDAVNHIAKDESFKDADIDENGNINFISRIQNLPEVNDYLMEIRAALFTEEDYSKYILIGEAGGIDSKSAKMYTGRERKELDMLFHFDFHSVGRGAEAHLRRKIDLIKDFKEAFQGWIQREDSEGWHPLFYSNHDTTRTVSRLGNDSPEFLIPSAKALAFMQLTQKGTPFIYYGDELGMTNSYHFKLEDYRDVAVKNTYNLEKDKENFNFKNFLKGLHLTNRDNARTPMQWNSSVNAGFTDYNPWIKVNPDYLYRNVDSLRKDNNSLLNTYRNLIKLRKENDCLVYGRTIEYLHENSKIYCYEREMDGKYFLIIVNYSEDKIDMKHIICDLLSELPVARSIDEEEALRHLSSYSLSLSSDITKYEDSITKLNDIDFLEPYESLIFSKK